MNKHLIVTLLLQLSFSFIYSQTKITKELAREINEQIFDTDNYPKTIMPSNKRYEPIKGSIEEETIFYSDSIKIINTYNKTGSLLKSKSFKKNILRGEYFYEYKDDGKTLIKERGFYKLDYTVYEENKYSTKYYAIKATEKQKSHRFLDTLFINETKYSYEVKRKNKLKSKPIRTFLFRYNRLGYLKQIQKSENGRKVGHIINFYNDNNQVVKQEDFWEYEWFYNDIGLSFAGNFIYELEYKDNGIIKSIKKRRYNAVKHEWEKSITNYNSVISKEGNLLKAHFFNDSGVNMKIKIDSMGNWVYKSESHKNAVEITKRTLKYFQ